jgi:DNA-binding IclR family transcriptional regulator
VAKAPHELDLSKLSERGRTILVGVARPIAEGCQQTELAALYGVSPHKVHALVAELRRELADPD